VPEGDWEMPGGTIEERAWQVPSNVEAIQMARLAHITSIDTINCFFH
jgi:hypothetical protein